MGVLVTGGAGYIGSHMLLELLSTGEHVVCLDNFSTGVRENVPNEVTLIEGDVGDYKLVSNIIGSENIDSVIHFAGSIIVPESAEDPVKYYQNNVVRSFDLIKACIDCSIKNFIFSSTASVYGMAEKLPVTEEAPLKPISPYGNTKLAIELMLADCAAAGLLNYIALRYFNVAGADGELRTGQSTPNATHLIKAAVREILSSDRKIAIFGDDYPTPDGTCIRDYIHVTDLVKAHLCALDYLRKQGGSLVLNCGYGKGYSVREVLDMVQRIANKELNIEISERRKGDPTELIADSSRLREALNWMPEHNDLEIIVRDAFNWEKKLRGF